MKLRLATAVFDSSASKICHTSCDHATTTKQSELTLYCRPSL